MNRDRAKTILLLYRPGTADADDPEIAEALALARRDPELTRWLVEHCARQETVRAGYRKITPPAGLKEQIISEQAARTKTGIRRQRAVLVLAVVAAMVVILTPLWFQHRLSADTFATLQQRMAGVALRGYGMDLVTNNPASVRAYLARNHAPGDYVLPAPLEKTAVAGCAIQEWQGTKVSMICFRTGRPLPPGEQSDLWLFVIDRSRVKDAPPADVRQFGQVSRLRMVTWTVGDKLYVLGLEGDEQTLRQYL